jgi:glycine/serine hydroxymethyltransferase
MGMVAEYIDKVLRNIEDEKLISKISSQVKNFTKDFPIPGIS